MNLDEDAIKALRDSFEKVGQVYSIIVCKQHPDFVIAGRHRKAAGGDLTHLLDVEVKCKTLGISHNFAHVVLRQHLNLQRTVTEDERREEFLEMAKLIESQGVEKSKVTAYLIRFSTFSDRYIRDLLPDEYKQTQMRGQKDERIAELSSASTSEPEPKEPYAKGLSHSLKENNPAQLTPSHLKLFGLIRGIEGTNFLNEEPHARANPADADEYTNELNKDGSPKSYQTDLTDYGLKLVVEAMGEGSSSDDLKRDAHFEREGWQVLKFTNDEIERSPRLVRLASELTVEIIGLRAQLEASGRGGS